MSKSVTSVEIEDVLSSIRRLVSEDTKPKSEAKPVAEDKLVLTAADRVADPAPAVQETKEISAEEHSLDHAQENTFANGSAVDLPEDSEPEHDGEPQPDEAPAVDAAAAEDAETSQDHTETHESQDVSDAQDEQNDAPETQSWAGSIEDVQTPDEPAEVEASDPPLHSATIENRIAELEEAVDGQPDEWEPDGSEMTAANDDVVTSIPAFLHRSDRGAPLAQEEAESDPWDAAEDTDEADHGEHAEEHAEDEAYEDHSELQDLQEEEPEVVHGEDFAEDAEVVHETASQEHQEDHGQDHMSVEGETTGSAGDFTPRQDTPKEAPFVHVDTSQNDFHSGDDAPQEVEASASGIDGTVLESAAAEEALEAALSDDSDDEAYLDEETIRDMVREIVREELQGVLGERITRNVRKLVRREIHRALTSNELE